MSLKKVVAASVTAAAVTALSVLTVSAAPLGGSGEWIPFTVLEERQQTLDISWSTEMIRYNVSVFMDGTNNLPEGNYSFLAAPLSNIDLENQFLTQINEQTPQNPTAGRKLNVDDVETCPLDYFTLLECDFADVNGQAVYPKETKVTISTDPCGFQSVYGYLDGTFQLIDSQVYYDTDSNTWETVFVLPECSVLALCDSCQLEETEEDSDFGKETSDTEGDITSPDKPMPENSPNEDSVVPNSTPRGVSSLVPDDQPSGNPSNPPAPTPDNRVSTGDQSSSIVLIMAVTGTAAAGTALALTRRKRSSR